jgi:hypothetical protein
MPRSMVELHQEMSRAVQKAWLGTNEQERMLLRLEVTRIANGSMVNERLHVMALAMAMTGLLGEIIDGIDQSRPNVKVAQEDYDPWIDEPADEELAARIADAGKGTEPWE